MHVQLPRARKVTSLQLAGWPDWGSPVPFCFPSQRAQVMASLIPASSLRSRVASVSSVTGASSPATAPARSRSPVFSSSSSADSAVRVPPFCRHPAALHAPNRVALGRGSGEWQSAFFEETGCPAAGRDERACFRLSDGDCLLRGSGEPGDCCASGSPRAPGHKHGNTGPTNPECCMRFSNEQQGERTRQSRTATASVQGTGLLSCEVLVGVGTYRYGLLGGS